MYNLKCQSEGTSAVCGRRIYLLKFIGHHSVWRQNCPRRRKYKSSSYPKARKIFYFRCENSPGFFFIFSFIFFFLCVNFKRYDLNFFYSRTLNMFKNICYITFLAFEQEVALALKLNCRQGVFIFRNIEGNMFDIN